MTTLVTYSLQILGPESEMVSWSPSGTRTPYDDQDKRVLSNLPALIEAAEEDLSDLLPEGYEVKITEALT